MNIAKGDKLRALCDIRYVMGQVPEDKIGQGEVVTVEKVIGKDPTSITVEEHADRYGPWLLSDFEKVDQTESKCFDCHGYPECEECEATASP